VGDVQPFYSLSKCRNGDLNTTFREEFLLQLVEVNGGTVVNGSLNEIEISLAPAMRMATDMGILVGVANDTTV
jgi:hypothetical protein